MSVFLVFVCACSGGSSGGGGGVPAPSLEIALDFVRTKTSQPSPFTVQARISQGGSAVTGEASSVTISSSLGAVGGVTETSPGLYQCQVTPTQTGEHAVTVGLSGVQVTRTALVIETVHPDWGQAQAVSGLVNTEGYEDGVTISPDGEYLFVQYGAFYFSGIVLFNTPRAQGGCGGDRLNPSRCSHPYLDNVIGPVSGPERPGFFTGRIANGMNLHNAESYMLGVDQAQIFAPTSMFYGFRRQADGSYAEPFYLAFEDENDGLINPFGMSFRRDGPQTATMVFALNDPSDAPSVDLDNDGSVDVESLFDIYTATVQLGQDNILGRYVASGTAGQPPVRDSFFPSVKLGFSNTGLDGHAGTQGNPHLHSVGGVIESVWTDDEFDAGGDRGDISVNVLSSGTFPTGTWQKVVLPAVVNEAFPVEEIQPYFSGTELFFTRKSDTVSPEVFVAAYSGGNSAADYGNAANWSTPVKVLGLSAGLTIGQVVALGEPTVASIGGKEVLFFVYAIIRDIDAVTGIPDFNLQAGFIRKE